MNLINNITQLINDILSDKISCNMTSSKEYTNEAIRQGFFEILGENRITYQNYRLHKNEIFMIIENIFEKNIFSNLYFENQFIESKNAMLGDDNRFVVGDDYFLFTKNICQELCAKQEFLIQNEWIEIDFFEEFISFLNREISIEQMMLKMQHKLIKEINSKLYYLFNNVCDMLVPVFQTNCEYDKNYLIDLIIKTRKRINKNVLLVGTDFTFRKMIQNSNNANYSDELYKETNLKVGTCIIPKDITNSDKKNDNTILVLPSEEKIIKIFFNGDVRAKQNNEDNFESMAIRVGTGIIIPKTISKYIIV